MRSKTVLLGCLAQNAKNTTAKRGRAGCGLNLVKAARNDAAALRAADAKLGQRSFKFPRGFEIFPFAASSGLTIGSLKR